MLFIDHFYKLVQTYNQIMKPKRLEEVYKQTEVFNKIGNLKILNYT